MLGTITSDDFGRAIVHGDREFELHARVARPNDGHQPGVNVGELCGAVEKVFD